MRSSAASSAWASLLVRTCFFKRSRRFATLLHLGQIGQAELQVDHLGIAGRPHRAAHVDHVVVFKTTHHVHDRVDLADVGQKLVAQALPLAGAFHQAGDIDKLHLGGDDLLAAAHVGEQLQAGIWHRHDARIGLDRAERIVGGFGLGVGHQGVEQGRLAHIGQTDDSGFEHGWNLRAAG